jgi:hypothetical protein
VRCAWPQDRRAAELERATSQLKPDRLAMAMTTNQFAVIAIAALAFVIQAAAQVPLATIQGAAAVLRYVNEYPYDSNPGREPGERY